MVPIHNAFELEVGVRGTRPIATFFVLGCVLGAPLVFAATKLLGAPGEPATAPGNGGAMPSFADRFPLAEATVLIENVSDSGVQRGQAFVSNADVHGSQEVSCVANRGGEDDNGGGDGGFIAAHRDGHWICKSPATNAASCATCPPSIGDGGPVVTWWAANAGGEWFITPPLVLGRSSPSPAWIDGFTYQNNTVDVHLADALAPASEGPSTTFVDAFIVRYSPTFVDGAGFLLNRTGPFEFAGQPPPLPASDAIEAYGYVVFARAYQQFIAQDASNPLVGNIGLCSPNPCLGIAARSSP
ncbi:MAG: hypothetical protein ACYDDF_06605 [Thermoplasmatota archaeon]